jgi:hypothetical protein
MRQLYWTWPSARAEVEEAARLFEVSKDAIPASCSDHSRSCRLLRLLCGADTSAGCTAKGGDSSHGTPSMSVVSRW